MTEDNGNNSFTKRFANRTSSNVRGSFSDKYSSRNTRECALVERGKIYELVSKKTESKEAFSGSCSIKSKSRALNERSFADATRRSRSDLIYLVRGKDRGISAWHYILVDKDKKEIFLVKSRTGSMDVADYGEILYSGWGENPPQEIVDKINDEFGL
ncbi:hypothetical protein GOY13_00045 [Wolbachia endosymbiont of Cruorifilaria tuberocauda]|uniref:hypothetical protein n=1 Tax=Wolbachia endosymbiont of Cruorifilaria tuberocauda TaxID=1812111 RepID=UPI00158A58CF|nr:hypothetical protein [Wolbachia endosymbiont of Cruorifilaria tuberocauda]QKX01376.1 hypothetical protein GOY13_00045 [Wolbachia endosymbiont of Cruorifilaria tuberocauda]